MADKETNRYEIHGDNVSGNKYDQSGNFGIGHNEAEISGAKIAGILNAASQQETLTDLANTIQKLVAELENAERSPQAARQEAGEQLTAIARTNPSFKTRLQHWRSSISESIVGEAAYEVLKLCLAALGSAIV